MMEIILPELKCRDCKKFRTVECHLGADFTDENSLADMQCFELREISDYVQFFSDYVLDTFTLRHFVKNGVSLGLHIWNEGHFEPCEEFLKAWVERFAEHLGLKEKVKSYTVNEVIKKCERAAYFELVEEPLRIAFNNIVLDWKAFLEGNREEAFLPLESTKDKPCFHRIPHKLDLEFFDKVVGSLDFEQMCTENAKDVVEIFKAWVDEKWRLLFEIIGYTFYPSYGLHKAFMLVGDGRNGKSTYQKLVQKILGDENVAGVSLQDICSNRFAQAVMYHKLANIYADIPSKPIAYTGYFKILTGEDLVSADRKFKERITFRNYAKLLFSANELPEVTDMTDAFWRRWIILEFPNKFADNPNFFEETFTEDVIEKIIVLSLLAFVEVWVHRKFSVEGEANDFKEQWLRKANSIYAYVKSGIEDGRLKLDKESFAPSEELYRDYLEFCEGNDLEPQSKNLFTRELERLFGIVKMRKSEKGKRFYVYQGIELKESGGGDELSDFQSCEVCGGKATTRVYRDGAEHWLCGNCLANWQGNL